MAKSMEPDQYGAIPRKISARRAYFATLNLAVWLAQRLKSGDFSTLYAEMEVDERGESFDPALVDEWSELWGEDVDRTPEEALVIAVQFLRKERAWSEERDVHAAIRELEEASRIVRQSNDLPDAWHYWVDAIARSHE